MIQITAKDREILIREYKEAIDDENLLRFTPRSRREYINLYSVLDKLEIGYYSEFVKTTEKERDKEEVELCVACRQAQKLRQYHKVLSMNRDAENIELERFQAQEHNLDILEDVEIYRRFLASQNQVKEEGRIFKLDNTIILPNYFTTIDINISWEGVFK